MVDMESEECRNTQFPSMDGKVEDEEIDLGDFDIHKLQLKAIEERVQNRPPGICGPRWELQYRPPRMSTRSLTLCNNATSL